MVKPGYKQTEVGVLPEDWETSSLSAAFQKLEAGVSVNSDNSLSSEYHILKTSAVHDGVVDTAETKPVIPQDYLRLKCPLVKGSIIISRMNTPALVGECGFAKDAKAGTYLPDRLWQIQNLNKSSFDFVWLNYLLNTKQYRDAVRATATGTSNSMKNISKERMLDIEIPRPPISEQENIAAVLSEVDELINLIEKQINKEKAIKQGAMQELLTGKRRLPGFSGEWSKCKLGSLGVFLKGTGISRNDSNSGNLPAVRYGELYTKHQNYVNSYFSHISKEVASNAQRIYRGDILFAASGETKEDIGKCSAIIYETAAYAGGDILIFRPTTQLDPVFMGTLLNMADARKQRAAQGQGDAVVHIHADALSSISIIIPNIEEQKAIAEILIGMDKEIELLKRKLEKYRQVKQGMMQQLLTGKIRLM